MKSEEVIGAIGKHNGNLSAVARQLKVSRQAVYNHLENDPAAKEALEQARETMLDNAESVLYRKVLEGSTPELIFFLKTQGKSRGYTERQEVTGADGAAITIKVVYGDPDDNAT